jgi:very-short-patch-repair endonuclease
VNFARPQALVDVTPTPPPPFGRKPGAQPAIFSIKAVSHAGGRKPAESVRIFSALRARSTGVSAVAELAAVQRALVQRRQLVAAGIGRSTIETLQSRGVLFRVLRGVYAVGTPELQPLAAETAALLHLVHDAALSHHSAAAIWDLMPASETVHVTLLGRGLRPREPLRLYRVPALHPSDVALRHGLPVTAAARTIIDVAARVTTSELADLAAQARARGLVTETQLAEALNRARGRSGTRAVSQLRATEVGRALTRSHFERLLLALLIDAELPRPRMNATVNGHEVDALWPQDRLILECDSWMHHADRGAFENDRLRDQHHLARGHRVLRITYRQLVEEPLRIAVLLARALAAG